MPTGTYSSTVSPFKTVTVTVPLGHGMPTGASNVFVVAVESLSGLFPSGNHVVASVTSATVFTIAVTNGNDTTGKLNFSIVLAAPTGTNDWNLEVVTKATPVIDLYYSSTGVEWELTDAMGTIGAMTLKDSALFAQWDLTRSAGSIDQWEGRTDYLSTQWELTRSFGRMDLGRYALELVLNWDISAAVPAPGQFFLSFTAVGPDGEEEKIPLAPLKGIFQMEWQVAPTRTTEYTTVADVLNDACSMLGFLVATDATPDVQERLVAAINTAMTAIYAASGRLNSFNRDTLTLTVPAESSGAELPLDVLSVTGYASRMVDGSIVRQLPILTHRSEYDNYVSIYGQSSNADVQALYLDSRRDLSTAQALSHRLLVTPTPTVDTTISLDVTYDAPRYTWADYYRKTIVRLPHNYVTALLYPLVRKDVSSHLLFAASERLPAIDSQYQEARALLALVDPAPTAEGITR